MCIRSTYERTSLLDVTERKAEKVHVMAKTTKKLTNEDIDVAAMKVKDFLRQETQQTVNRQTYHFTNCIFMTVIQTH